MRKRWAAGVRVRIEALFLPLSNGRSAGTRVSNENRTHHKRVCRNMFPVSQAHSETRLHTIYMTLQKLLGFDKQKMSVRVEVIGGLTTFLTMCYILAVNPAILSTTGMDKAALFTGTAVAAGVATVLLAFMSRLPFAQAPSMGLNAFFAFTLCQAMGLTWQQALAVLLVEGILFILITFLNVRDLIMQCIPNNLRYAISAGIGMFIAFIGLKNAHIIVADPDTFVRLGRFSNECLLGIFSILFSGLLMVRGVKGALFYSILIATVVAIPMGVVSMPKFMESCLSSPQHGARVLPVRLLGLRQSRNGILQSQDDHGDFLPSPSQHLRHARHLGGVGSENRPLC